MPRGETENKAILRVCEEIGFSFEIKEDAGRAKAVQLGIAWETARRRGRGWLTKGELPTAIRELASATTLALLESRKKKREETAGKKRKPQAQLQSTSDGSWRSDPVALTGSSKRQKREEPALMTAAISAVSFASALREVDQMARREQLSRLEMEHRARAETIDALKLEQDLAAAQIRELKLQVAHLAGDGSGASSSASSSSVAAESEDDISQYLSNLPSIESLVETPS